MNFLGKGSSGLNITVMSEELEDLHILDWVLLDAITKHTSDWISSVSFRGGASFAVLRNVRDTDLKVSICCAYLVPSISCLICFFSSCNWILVNVFAKCDSAEIGL